MYKAGWGKAPSREVRCSACRWRDRRRRIDGVRFEDAWPARVATTFGGEPAAVLAREHLILNERASGRLQDLADLERLERGDDD